MKPEPHAARRKSAKKREAGRPARSGATNGNEREYVGFYAPAGTKKAARRKLGGVSITKYCLGALRALIDGDATPTTPAASFGDPLITEGEAARLLGISRPTLRDLRLSGDVEFIQFGERLIKYDPKYLRETLLPKFTHKAKGGDDAPRG